MDPDYLPFHPNPSRPRFVPPVGAVDAHCHVFGPGDVIVADDDGVVVVPRERAAAVAAASDAREKKEEATRKRLAEGELGLDIYGMRDTLAKAGLEYPEK